MVRFHPGSLEQAALRHAVMTRRAGMSLAATDACTICALGSIPIQSTLLTHGGDCSGRSSSLGRYPIGSGHELLTRWTPARGFEGSNPSPSASASCTSHATAIDHFWRRSIGDRSRLLFLASACAHLPVAIDMGGANLCRAATSRVPTAFKPFGASASFPPQFEAPSVCHPPLLVPRFALGM